jgi:hypothetical protein
MGALYQDRLADWLSVSDSDSTEQLAVGSLQVKTTRSEQNGIIRVYWL